MKRSPFELTPREKEVMLWVSKGKTNWEIGRILGCSALTVKCHVSRIREKLDVHNKAHAVAIWRDKDDNDL